ncbi:MAG: SusF/SusE family outer membrane protein [Dysgonamonadaceae bacterium]|jgi:hypothetical protein|nr:SusF/SusE family outer membrane protein [Dysgonamonadaceae bacterium]
MKKFSLLVFLCVFAFTACEKDEDMYKVLPVEQVKAPVLATHDAIVIHADNYQDNTMFTWQAADFGVPTATEYSMYTILDEQEPVLVTATFGDTLHVSLLAIGKVLYQSGITLDAPVDVKFYVVASIADTYGTVSSAPISVSVTVGSDVPLYPDNVYMIGKEFGDWNWNNAGVVEMTPINGHSGKFWAIRYFADPANGFKWCNVKDWKGDFSSLGAEAGFTTHDGNAFVSATGFYIVVVDYTINTITIEPAQVYGIGDCFGGWNAGQYPFAADGRVMKLTTSGAGNLRIYADAVAAGVGGDWWRMEFVILDGKIVYRGNGDDQEQVPVTAGKTITLDFNNETGIIQ